MSSEKLVELQIEDSTARQIYKSASPEIKILLEENFGKGFFSDKVTDRVKTFKDACKETGVQYEGFESALTHAGLSADEIAYKKIKIIAEALNEGWKPDYSNSNQAKYYPWFKYKAGSGFSYSNYGSSNTGTGVGSRLVFKSSDLAMYAGTQFEAEYQAYL